MIPHPPLSITEGIPVAAAPWNSLIVGDYLQAATAMAIYNHAGAPITARIVVDQMRDLYAEVLAAGTEKVKS